MSEFPARQARWVYLVREPENSFATTLYTKLAIVSDGY